MKFTFSYRWSDIIFGTLIGSLLISGIIIVSSEGRRISIGWAWFYLSLIVTSIFMSIYILFGGKGLWKRRYVEVNFLVPPFEIPVSFMAILFFISGCILYNLKRYDSNMEMAGNIIFVISCFCAGLVLGNRARIKHREKERRRSRKVD